VSLQTLSDELLAEISKILAKYPHPRAALLPILHSCQRQLGHISSETEAAVAELVGIPAIEVRETVSFYGLLNPKPVGKYHLQFCTNLSCSLLGADEAVATACKRLGIREGETTPDHRFTVSTVECLGACDMSPSLQVNDDYHANMTTAKVADLLDRLK
jgi:NADH-quinone oxidoreductase E subunit